MRDFRPGAMQHSALHGDLKGAFDGSPAAIAGGTSVRRTATGGMQWFARPDCPTYQRRSDSLHVAQYLYATANLPGLFVNIA